MLRIILIAGQPGSRCLLPRFTEKEVRSPGTSQYSTKPNSRGVTTTTADGDDEVRKFEKLSVHWWDESHRGLSLLHAMNELRVPFIRDGMLQQARSVAGPSDKEPTSLEGYKFLDIGCGGGILCEPLGKLGATVLGIDPGQENISAALSHLPRELAPKVSYKCVTIEALAARQEEKNKYDAVVMSEVIEHVDHPPSFVEAAATVLKPGGSLFLTTIDRKVLSVLDCVIWWEYILGNVPIGTHDWRKFLTPQETEKILTSCGLKVVTLREKLRVNAVTATWKWSKICGTNYAIQAVKI